MNDVTLNRKWTERYYAERGFTLSDDEWVAIVSAVDSAPSLPTERVQQIAALIRPVPTPPADTPSTRKYAQQHNPRPRRAERAA